MPPSTAVLLVEDNAAEAELYRDYLADGTAPGRITVTHDTRLASALARFAAGMPEYDVVLLDLSLPDAQGVDTIGQVRARTEFTPIVVLTGAPDHAMAMDCIDAGATDYLLKSEVRPHTLRRAIGYAQTRRREAELRELRRVIERLRGLTSREVEAPVTALLSGMGPLSARQPTVFAGLFDAYRGLLEEYLRYLVFHHPKPQDAMERFATMLGDQEAGPRDLLDLHVAALEEGSGHLGARQHHAEIVEGRLLALELMGLMVDYYRSGHRRRFHPGGTP